MLACALLASVTGRTAQPARQETDGAAAGSRPPAYRVFPDRPKQVIRGLGFEIQSDSIGSGNQGLPDGRVAVPHDLVPSERSRLAAEMLRGFRYCRLAGGLYWRGLDATGRQLRERWPGQLEELRALLAEAGVEGLSFEYWSPAPYWKGNRRLVGGGREDAGNRLRCLAPGFDADPDYAGDEARFLDDFARAVVGDIRTLEAAGLRVALWGLQNEPHVSHGHYPTCLYPDAGGYVRAYRAVAAAVRRHDPGILLFADTEGGFPKKIAAGMGDPAVAALVDAYAVHTVGAPSQQVAAVHARIRAELPHRPWFQNEYEYLTGGATRERCLNTVQHIMNSFQLGENPTWFWIHALKPAGNAEASGYALGFWRSLEEPGTGLVDERLRRWRGGPEYTELPERLARLEMIVAARGDPARPGVRYDFSVDRPVTVHLLAEETEGAGWEPGAGWVATGEMAAWCGGRDRVYRRSFGAGRVDIPENRGRTGERHGAPHAVWFEPAQGAGDAAAGAGAGRPGGPPLRALIGVNVPIQIRSEALAQARALADLRPGHWLFNRYNWHAVGSFVRRLPWDSTAVAVEEPRSDPHARLLAFLRPGGKLTVVLSNRTAGARSFEVETGRAGATWRGWRYTPEEAGDGALGVPAGSRAGGRLGVALPSLSWEFWEEQ